MRLAVATLCSHCWHDGRWWAYEPYVREANRWANLFDELSIVAPTEDGPPPAFYAPYDDSADLEVLSFRHNQGLGVDQKRTRFRELPRMATKLLRASLRSDAICLRAPSNIALVGLLLGPLLGRRRVARYTGQWTGYPAEALSYRIQRFLLASRWWGSTTLVYGESGRQPTWVVPSFNAILTDSDLPAHGTPPNTNDEPTIVFVGRLSRAKNVDVLLRSLSRQTAPWRLEILGDGPQREALESLARSLGIAERTHFRGAVTYDEVLATHRRAQVLILASETEGWPKALVEGMTFGLACAGSRRGLMPEILSSERGWLVEPGNEVELTRALGEMLSNDESVLQRRRNAMSWARQFTLDRLERQIAQILTDAWGAGSVRTGNEEAA